VSVDAHVDLRRCGGAGAANPGPCRGYVADSLVSGHRAAAELPLPGRSAGRPRSQRLPRQPGARSHLVGRQESARHIAALRPSGAPYKQRTGPAGGRRRARMPLIAGPRPVEHRAPAVRRIGSEACDEVRDRSGCGLRPAHDGL
jgi:hypothetical protein